MFRAYQEKNGEDLLRNHFQKLEGILEPETAAAKHRWLFESTYIEWPSLVLDEGEERLTWTERESHVQRARTDAILEIQSELGESGILLFAMSVKHPELVAQVLVTKDTSNEIAAEWITRVLIYELSVLTDAILSQILRTLAWNDLLGVISILKENDTLSIVSVIHRVVDNLPGFAAGWAVAEHLGQDLSNRYWKSVSVNLWQDTTDEDIEFAIVKLLSVNRPRSALSALIYMPERLAAKYWIKILQAVSNGEEPEGKIPDGYHLGEIFKNLDSDRSITNEQLAMLELPYVPLLCGYGHRNHERTLAVHRMLATDPDFFVQLLSWLYKPRNSPTHPEEENISQERREVLAELAYHTLEGWNIVPGLAEDGVLNDEQFSSWAIEALKKAEEVDRKEVAENHISSMLARYARRLTWESWLPVSILNFLERPECMGLRDRFELGVRNARGITSRGPYDGGEQERQLAKNYYGLATQYQHSHPRVSSLLRIIAEDYEKDARSEDDDAVMSERWRP